MSKAREGLGGTPTTRAQKRPTLAISLVIDETPEWAEVLCEWLTPKSAVPLSP